MERLNMPRCPVEAPVRHGTNPLQPGGGGRTDRITETQTIGDED